MSLNISENKLSNTSIRFLAELIEKFDGFVEINMANVNQLQAQSGSSGYAELAQAIKSNHSLVSLDLRNNGAKEKDVVLLMEALSENFVLSDLKLDVERKKLRDGTYFSNYPLLSMYNF